MTRTAAASIIAALIGFVLLWQVVVVISGFPGFVPKRGRPASSVVSCHRNFGPTDVFVTRGSVMSIAK